VRRTGSPVSTFPFRSLRGAPPQLTRTRVAGVASSSGDVQMFSIAVGFGVSTLVGTGLLLVMQMVEDFRDA